MGISLVQALVDRYHWKLRVADREDFHNDTFATSSVGRTVNAKLKDLAEEINDRQLIETDSHNILVYDEMQSFKEFYSECAKKSLSSGEIFLLASQYEDVERVKRNLASCGIDVGGHLAQGTLYVLDAQKGYFGSDDIEGVFKLALTLDSRAKKEQRKGLTGIADMGSFFAFHAIRRLIDYELVLPQKNEQTMKTVCCYHEKDFGNLSVQDGRSLMSHHYKAILLRK